MTRIVILLLFIAAGCNAQPKLTMILVADSVIAYNGELSASSKITRFLSDESTVKAFLADNKRKYSDRLWLTMKLADNGGGNAMRAAEAFLMLERLANSMNIKKHAALPDSNEQKTFSIEVFQRPGIGEPLPFFLPKPDSTVIKTDPRYILTLELHKDSITYYAHEQQPASIAYAGIGEIITAFKRSIGDSLLVVITPAEDAGYKNTVDVLDQMSIHNVARYTMADEVVTEESPTVKMSETTTQPDLTFYLNDNVLFYSTSGKDKIKLSPATTENVVRIIEQTEKKLNKKAPDLMVIIEGKASAKFDRFKVLIDAMKQKDMFNFKMVTN